MSNLSKKLAGAYDNVECVKATGVKYCEDNTIGTKPMIDLYDNKISVDTPVINDMHDDLSLGGDPKIVGDVNEEISKDIEVEILNLLVRS